MERQVNTQAGEPAMTERYLCVHGHFYQPPRQNPWLEEIEAEASAAPFHDWNERITAECYAPNAAARIVDGEGRLLEIHNTYTQISFNFGPTLLAWLEKADPTTYQQIIAADRLSRASRGRPWQCHGAGLQSCDHAAGEPARQSDAGGLGHR